MLDKGLTPYRLVLHHGPKTPNTTSQATVHIMNKDPTPFEGHPPGRHLGDSSHDHSGAHTTYTIDEGNERMLPSNLNCGTLSNPFRQTPRFVQPQTSREPFHNSSRTVTEPAIRMQTSGPPCELNKIARIAESQTQDWRNELLERSVMPVYKDNYHPVAPRNLNAKASAPSVQSDLSQAYQTYIKKDQDSNRRGSASSESKYHKDSLYSVCRRSNTDPPLQNTPL